MEFITFIKEYENFLNISEIARFSGMPLQTFKDKLRNDDKSLEPHIEYLFRDMRNKLNEISKSKYGGK